LKQEEEEKRRKKERRRERRENRLGRQVVIPIVVSLSVAVFSYLVPSNSSEKKKEKGERGRKRGD